MTSPIERLTRRPVKIDLSQRSTSSAKRSFTVSNKIARQVIAGAGLFLRSRAAIYLPGIHHWAHAFPIPFGCQSPLITLSRGVPIRRPRDEFEAKALPPAGNQPQAIVKHDYFQFFIRLRVCGQPATRPANPGRGKTHSANRS